MGLDTVELVIAIEEEFGIEIPDADGAGMYTVGDTYEWLKERISKSDSTVCLTQSIFYKMRRALIENYGLDRNAIRPDSRITDFIPLEEVETGWPFLQQMWS